METLRSIGLSMEMGDFMVSLEIQDAYLHVAMALSHRHYLRFAILQQHSQFQVVPFGLATAPQFFTKIMVVMAAQLLCQGIRIFPYLDIRLILAQSQETLYCHLQVTIAFL